MTATSLRLQRLLPASVTRVFEAWSRPELMARWFVVEPSWKGKATADFRVGGRYRVEMDRGDGTIFVAFGEYLEIIPPRRLVFTWSSAVPAVTGSVVTVELAPFGEDTQLTLTHELLPDTEEGRAHAVGWEGTLGNLHRHLSQSLAGGAP
jgi:uncharacterized protein YndB with AHSA1/START domain